MCKPEQLRQWWCSGWNLEQAMHHIGLFWRIGSSGMVMMSVEVWAFEILSIMAGVLPNSVVALATHSVLMNVNVMLWTVFYGIAVAASIRVGNCLGANQPKKAKMARNLALAMTLAVSLVFTILLFSLSDHIPRLFLSSDESIDLASKIMAAWSPLEIADGLNAVMQGIFRGAGKQRSAAIANVVGYYGGGISLAAILAFALDQGVEGLWWGIGFGIVATLVAMTFMMLNYWKWDELADDARQRTAH
ncbi:Multidrug/Oligosaccharidyl-lipid/polysaccharide (MOP) Flippase Superfamily [Phytophthora palmivora]|uniref:Multidrug/Oligosaccharidyl-lipid/polysaccharide (MOP) Flippase Superfamily n=1 Tax=Phytophthora palmivora TaxID=4796 RepID=A0A2P4YB87_9STRA|nr:Multidrug/Oligosaccharidyl-lipid/polysaccharide (MOP) Flippase Superfamily [Phytophthora palmivora]